MLVQIHKDHNQLLVCLDRGTDTDMNHTAECAKRATLSVAVWRAGGCAGSAAAWRESSIATI